MDKTFDPEKYGMTFCPLCKGDGKLAKMPEGFEVCKECGGFGLIKKECQMSVHSLFLSKPAKGGQ